MPTKICAAALLVLSLSPFTAPFSTCDLAILLGHIGSGNAVSAHALSSVRLARADDEPSLLPTSSRLVKPECVRLFNSPSIAADYVSSTAILAVNASRGLPRGSTPPLRAPSLSLTTILRL